MKHSNRKALWAYPIFCIVFSLSSGRADSASLSGPDDSGSGDSTGTFIQRNLDEGSDAIRKGRSEAALASFMKARNLGMSHDSLCYFLAEAAASRAALDTALAFNLSIATPAGGVFRQTVLLQRHRIYSRAGMARAAAALTDSMETHPSPASGKTHELSLAFGTGYFVERDFPGVEHPFGGAIAGARSKGAQYRHRAQLTWPCFRAGDVPWSGGVGYDLVKSYFKDSLDYRAGLVFKAENLFLDSLATELSVQAGDVSGTGFVSSYQLESSFLSFSGMGVTLIQGGVESEWNGKWKNRSSGFWASYYRDNSLRTGSGFLYSFSVSGVAFEPLRETASQKILYVDDVRKTAPVHYRDSTFAVILPGNGNSAFGQYTSNAGVDGIRSISPQGYLNVAPTLGYGFPLPLDVSGEIGCEYSVSYFPRPQIRTEASLPAGYPGDAGDFSGLALNRADGKRYVAVLKPMNPGVQEAYGSTPVVERKNVRVDQQWGLDLYLRRKLAGWGTLTTNGTFRRNVSTLSGISTNWIPKWEWGAALKWSKGWKW